MRRAFSFIFAGLFIAVGIAGVGLGIARIAVDGDVGHGLANMVVGGLVALTGVQNWLDAV